MKTLSNNIWEMKYFLTLLSTITRMTMQGCHMTIFLVKSFCCCCARTCFLFHFQIMPNWSKNLEGNIQSVCFLCMQKAERSLTGFLLKKFTNLSKVTLTSTIYAFQLAFVIPFKNCINWDQMEIFPVHFLLFIFWDHSD